MCIQQSLRPACYWPEQHLEFLNLKGGYTGLSESIHLSKYHIVGNHMSQLNNFEIASLIKQKNVEMWCENYNNISILQAPIPDSSINWEFLDVTITVNPGRDPYNPLWKFLPNVLIIFQHYFQIQWWIGKMTFNLWKNLRADFIYFHFNLHQWLVYKTSVIIKYFTCDHTRNLLGMKLFVQVLLWRDYEHRFWWRLEETTNKIISQIFKGVINLPLA